MVELLAAMTSFANAIEQQATFEVAWKILQLYWVELHTVSSCQFLSGFERVLISKWRNVKPRFDFHWQFLPKYQKFLKKKSYVENSLKTYLIHSKPDRNWQELSVWAARMSQGVTEVLKNLHRSCPRALVWSWVQGQEATNFLKKMLRHREPSFWILLCIFGFQLRNCWS